MPQTYRISAKKASTDSQKILLSSGDVFHSDVTKIISAPSKSRGRIGNALAMTLVVHEPMEYFFYTDSYYDCKMLSRQSQNHNMFLYSRMFVNRHFTNYGCINLSRNTNK